MMRLLILVIVLSFNIKTLFAGTTEWLPIEIHNGHVLVDIEIGGIKSNWIKTLVRDSARNERVACANGDYLQGHLRAEKLQNNWHNYRRHLIHFKKF